jgi:cytoskeletal protein CcmA (bactofilin family)
LVKATDEQRTARCESLIARGTSLVGDVEFSDGLRIDGEVQGCIRGMTGTLVIGETGRVAGDVEVARLIVSGVVTGRVIVRDLIRLQTKARLECDVVYGMAEIHSGAVIQGRLIQRPAVQDEGLDAADPFDRLAPAAVSL